MSETLSILAIILGGIGSALIAFGLLLRKRDQQAARTDRSPY